MDGALFGALECLIKTREERGLELVLSLNIIESLNAIGIEFKDVAESNFLIDIQCKVKESDTVEWKFLSTLCYYMLYIKHELNDDDNAMLSVNQQKSVRDSLQFIVSMGLLPSLLLGVGISIDERSIHAQNYKGENLSPMQKYSRLKSMCYFLTEISKTSQLRAILFNNHFGDYLAALYQLSYAPITKPNTKNDQIDFVMSEELWNRLQREQTEFINILQNIISTSPRHLVMKELIFLQGRKLPKPPLFMRKAISKDLSEFLTSPGGLVCTMKCFLDSPIIDTGTQWKHIESITQLISVKHGPLSIDEYLCNMCAQLSDIIHCNVSENDYTVVAAACVTKLYETFENNSHINKLVKSLLAPFLLNANNDSVQEFVILTSAEVHKLINMLYMCFTIPKLCLPSELLTPIMPTLFSLRENCTKSMAINTKLNDLIMKNFLSNDSDSNLWFSTLIFKSPCDKMVTLNYVIFEQIEEGTQIKQCAKNEKKMSVEKAMNCILEILTDNPEGSVMACKLFTYCLTILSTNQFSTVPNNQGDVVYNVMDKNTENQLIIIKTLETLSSMDCILNYFKKNPMLIAKFIENILSEYTDIENIPNESHEESIITIILILLSTLLSDDNTCNIIKVSSSTIEKSLNLLINKTSRDDVKFLSKEVINLLTMEPSEKTKSKSEFENAISEICDPLLPVRAHGLMQLSKLICEKDTETLSKKHLVQCIFQENLQNEDSYIYLTAINGLSSVAKYCTEDVLDILTKEFIKQPEKLATDIERENLVQIRMKIGEVLVKITKNLGEMAPNHKSILLNTFMTGCRDHDDLIRTSSLSNLAEVARVMSYKLGSIIFEILKLIDDILESDKSPSCRRAAVLVISSLLKGLGKEAISFLKEALLPLYRTLKRLYNDEKEDDVVRLHSQIALEELNSIVKDLLFNTLKNNEIPELK